MTNNRIAHMSLVMVAILGALLLAMALSTGISEAQGPDGATRGGYGTGDGISLLPPANPDGLSEEAIAALMAGLQDEYHAYAVYQAVIDQFGPVLPFTRIQAAEAQHIASLEALFDRYSLPVPAPLPVEGLPVLTSVADACALGAQAEVANLELYDSWMAQSSDYPDLVQVFTALRDASEFNHLPAFEQCAG